MIRLFSLFIYLSFLFHFEAQEIRSYKPECQELIPSKRDKNKPTIKTCFFKDYKSVLTIIKSIDNSLPVDFIHILYSRNIADYERVNKSSIFNNRFPEMLNHINKEIRLLNDSLLKDSETKSCFNAELTYYGIDDLGFSFTDSSVVFSAILPSPYEPGHPNCLYISPLIEVPFSIHWFNMYLK
jgi:hypothetical protein